MLDDRDDRVAGLFDRMSYLMTTEECGVKAKADPRQLLQRRLLHLEQNLWKVAKAVSKTRKWIAACWNSTTSSRMALSSNYMTYHVASCEWKGISLG